MLSGQATATPKTGDGPVEGLRALKVVQRSANKARTQALNQLRALVATAPAELREKLPPFDAATVALARTAAALTADGSLVSVAGGGDTVAALNDVGVAGDLTYVSSAGGAFLEWMEGKTLPGVAALG